LVSDRSRVCAIATVAGEARGGCAHASDWATRIIPGLVVRRPDPLECYVANAIAPRLRRWQV
jgi:hypothetical protein